MPSPTLDEQIDSFIADLTAGKTNEGSLLQRGIFLAGELDADRSSVDEIVAANGDIHKQTYLMLGRLGELVGLYRGGGVIATPDDLKNLDALTEKLKRLNERKVNVGNL